MGKTSRSQVNDLPNYTSRKQVKSVLRASMFDAGLTRAALTNARLTPRCEQFAEVWLSGWRGGQLPTPRSLPIEKFRKLSAKTMCNLVGPDGTRKVVYFGAELPRIMQARLLGIDWMAMVPKHFKSERLRRSASIADGAIFRTVRNVDLNTGGKYVFETLTVPFRTGSDGVTQVATFFDFSPPNKKSTLIGVGEIIRPPERAEFIQIGRRQSHASPVLSPEDVKIVSRAAVRMILSFTSELLKGSPSSQLDPLDYLIALAIGGANVSHIEEDSSVSRHYASDIEPDWMRRGISRAAIARETRIPLETVRRRVNKLIENKVLVERRDGLILSPDDPFDLSMRIDAMESTVALVDRLFCEIEEKGVVLRR